MTKVKVFVYGRRRHRRRRRRRRRRGYDNSSPDFRHGELKKVSAAILFMWINLSVYYPTQITLRWGQSVNLNDFSFFL